MGTDEGWIEIIRGELVPDGKATRAAYDDDSDLMLYRSGEKLFAIGLRCTHQGAPLDRGVVSVQTSMQTVTCAAHGSMFDLESGKVMRGPAGEPVPAFETRVTDGMIEVRPREA